VYQNLPCSGICLGESDGDTDGSGGGTKDYVARTRVGLTSSCGVEVGKVKSWTGKDEGTCGGEGAELIRESVAMSP
jgi:hypothetical protein